MLEITCMPISAEWRKIEYYHLHQRWARRDYIISTEENNFQIPESKNTNTWQIFSWTVTHSQSNVSMFQYFPLDCVLWDWQQINWQKRVSPLGCFSSKLTIWMFFLKIGHNLTIMFFFLLRIYLCMFSIPTINIILWWLISDKGMSTFIWDKVVKYFYL